MSRMFGRALKQPCERDLHGRCVQGRRYLVQSGGLQRSEAAQGEERDVGDALCGEVVDEGVVLAIDDVVEVLDADDVGDALGLLRVAQG